jgi:glycosyltransferase involved in cell wall biosynthesis
MKIIHIFWSFKVGGAETMLVDIINNQVQRNFVALMVINNNYSKNLLKEINKNVRIRIIKRKPKSRNPWNFIKINMHLLKNKYDVIHCHNYSINKVLLPVLLKKCVLTVHGFGIPIGAKNKYRHIIAISQAIYNDLFSKGVRNLSIIYNGVDPSKITKKKKYSKEEIKIVCVGRLEHEIKGQDILIKAFSLLRKYYPETKLYFIGEGKSKKYLKKLAKDFAVEENVIFQGLYTRKQLYMYLHYFDILVQPSNFEGFGLSVVEGMIAMLPTIISNSPGLVEVTGNGCFAQIALEQSEYVYYKLLQNLILDIKNENKELFQRIERAKRTISNKFSIEKTCNNYEMIYIKTCIQKTG